MPRGKAIGCTINNLANFLFLEEFSLIDITEDDIPFATTIQFGTRNITQVISIDDGFNEGDFLDLSQSYNPINQTQQQNSSIKFLDLFWFLNPTKKKENSNDLDLVTLGLNLNYGNLRINGYLNAKESLHNNALFITRDMLTINAAIYPSSVYYIRHLKNAEKHIPVEQLFVQYDPDNEPWHDSLPKTYFLKSNDALRMIIENTDNIQYSYIFRDKQYDLLNHALDYILNNGFNIVGSGKLR